MKKNKKNQRNKRRTNSTTADQVVSGRIKTTITFGSNGLPLEFLRSVTDDRSPFRSGDPDLDGYFQKFAGQNQFRHYVGVSCVAVDQGRILGFATVAPGNVEIAGLPAGAAAPVPLARAPTRSTWS